WTRIEVSGALMRAARTGRPGGRSRGRSGRGPDVARLLALLDGDLGMEGAVTVVAASQEQVETEALRIVRTHALRAMDAWHLAVAKLTLPALAEPGEAMGFASRAQAQREVAEMLGFRPV